MAMKMKMGKSLFVLAFLLWGVTQVAAQSSPASTNAQVRQNTPNLPQGISASWWQQVQANLRQREYHISKRHDGAYTSPNRAQNLRFVYEPNGFSATRRDSLAHLWQARLTFIGTSKRKGAVPAHTHEHFTLTAHANTLVAESETVTITYLNNENGMRQDFVVKHKPEGQDHLCVLLKPEMQHGTVRITNTALSFLTANGQEAMRYSGLKVWDARHKPLKAHFEQRENYLAIVVSDKNAQYPITIDPLSTTPNWTAESDQASARFGWSVASAGDVNNDGYSDVIVGAPDFDNGETDEGAAFVYHGSAFGLSPVPNWTAESDQAGAQFGYSVASAGDVNGDGFRDVIVGARLFDNGETDEGAAFVYHGSFFGLSSTPDWTAESNQANAEFGISVASAGDVNGDGFSDVIVGAWQYDNPETDEGAAFVYHGSIFGLGSTPNWTAESNQAGASYGFFVASAGDVNSDGISDVIVGAPLYDNGSITDAGAAYAYYGSSSGLNTIEDWFTTVPVASALYGRSVASAGNVNGDNYSDVIVGSNGYTNNFTGEGAAFVFYGSLLGLNTNPDWVTYGNQTQARYGVTVASAGDVNGDGFSDVIVGAWQYDNGETDEGAAFVYHGGALLNYVGPPSGISQLTYNNVTFTSSGAMPPSTAVTVAGTLTLNGAVDLNGNTITVVNSTSGAVTGSGSLTGTGSLVRAFNGNNTYSFPYTESGNNRTATVTFTGGATTGGLTFRFFNTPPGNAGLPQTIVGQSINVVAPFYWRIDATGTPGTYTLSLAGENTPGVTNVSTLRIAKRPNAGSWSSTGAGTGSANTGTLANPTVVQSGMTGFSEFSIGGGGGSDNPLPVELSAFTGAATPNGVRLQWKTQSEQNNAGFSILRSASSLNGSPTDAVEIASYRFDPSLRGKGTTTSATSYAFLDEGVETGKSYTYKLRSYDLDGTVHDHAQLVSVEVREPVAARVFSYSLSQNYPNPFNPTTVIKYSIKEAGKVSLKIYDVLGREVMTLVNQVQPAGEYALSFDAKGLSASGVYFYQLQSGSFTRTMKMMLVK